MPIRPPDLLPPAQPSFILRGHAAQIHALHFTPANTRLLTGDADGWLVSWNLAVKRPVAVWKAHHSAILGLGSWGPNRVITHGRDNRLLVWQLGPESERSMDQDLPVNTAARSPKPPWLLYAMPVNALNFCSFAMCFDGMAQASGTERPTKDEPPKPILFAVPNAVDSGGIDIFQLPSQNRAAVIHAHRSITTGMVMALGIQAETTRIQIAAGYESGHTMVFVQKDPGAAFENLYSAQPHTQPVLSLALSPCKELYITSSADATVAKHPLPFGKGVWKTELKPIRVIATKHSGQQGLSYRSDCKIFATACWDSHIRVYSGKTMRNVAVLKWHNEGCYTTAFAALDSSACPSPVIPKSDANEDMSAESERLPPPPPLSSPLSRSLSSEPPQSMTSSVQRRRDEKAQSTHWLAAGSKDGKVSLWNIY